MADEIPQEFYKGMGPQPAMTVGELIEQLQKLPKDLKINQGFGKGVRACVYNVNAAHVDFPHMEFQEVDEMDDFDDEDEDF